MTGRLETFQPLVPGRVKMFVCGPTVQDLLHLGHAKTYTFYDVLARFLRFSGFRLSYIMNITDVDDKITQAARDRGVDVGEYAQQLTQEFINDMHLLGVSGVTRYEPASKYIPQIIHQVERLIEKGHAYVSEGDVFFDTSTFPEFGELSHQSRDQMLLRPVDLSPKKKSTLDFTLWRRADDNEPSWPSPWGKGKPGWHIEDTAISVSNFGPQYDIHGGARELIYPHHEAEIAQAESFTGVKPFVKYWVHTGLLTTNGKKMSKSEGNAVYLRDILKRFGASALRLYVLSVKYREQLHYSKDDLERWVDKHAGLVESVLKLRGHASKKWAASKPSAHLEKFCSMMSQDFDTPACISLLFEVVKRSEGLRANSEADSMLNAVNTMGWLLGIDVFKRD